MSSHDLQPARHDRSVTASVIAIAVLTGMLTGLGNAQAQGVRGFGVEPGKLPFRSFGNPLGEEALRTQFPEAAAAITGDDRSLARKQISLTDANGDGIVTLLDTMRYSDTLRYISKH